EYNIRGWLTGISGENFSEKLHYHDVVPGLNNTPQWGGNISAMEWQTPGLNAGWHAFKYDYDPP
ncbi:MAG: hypothetical protein LBL04_13455, partial [Bacteroidales bacterium]|nr:hypothetical protein [Bacteroidales bacterium]